MNSFDINTYNRPVQCSKCGGMMIFAGVVATSIASATTFIRATKL